MASHALSSRLVILRIRSCVLIAVVTLGVLWIGLLSLEAFLRGGYRSVRESVAVITLLAVNAISSISIPILALLDYAESTEQSPWFSHVRFEFGFMSTLLVLQTTAALLFTTLSLSFRCDDPNGKADVEGDCRLLNVYISIASWLTPLILLSFLIYFSIVSFHAAKRFPALWRTAARFCQWDDRPMSWDSKVMGATRKIALNPGLRELENGNRTSISHVSSHHSSRGSSQSLTPLVNTRNIAPQRTSQPTPLRGAPVGRLSSQAVSQPPLPQNVSQHPSPRITSQMPPTRPPASLLLYRPVSQPPPMRGATHPQPGRVRSSNPQSRAPSHMPPTQMPSRPLPLHPATASGLPRSSPRTPTSSGHPPSLQPSSRSDAMKGHSSLDRYTEEWNRERRGLTMHPSWLGKR